MAFLGRAVAGRAHHGVTDRLRLHRDIGRGDEFISDAAIGFQRQRAE